MTQRRPALLALSARQWGWLIAALIVLALVWGVARSLSKRAQQQQALQAQTAAAAAQLQVPATDWLRVTTRQLQVQVPITGSLQAVDSALVKARVSGELRDLTVREGDSVRKGQVLARVDATESEARYRQAKLQADASQAQVTIQQRAYDNNRALVSQGFISSTALQTSLANLQAAQAQLAAARAAQDAARKTLDDTVLRSPIDGQIARRMAQNGERVSMESPVLEVVNLAQLELMAQLPANDSAAVQVGQTAQLQLQSPGHGGSVRAEVVRINPSADSSNRAVAVYLRLTEQPEGWTLRPGMYLQGAIDTGTLTSLAVPLNAVRTDQPQPYVQAVADGRVLHQRVQMGAQSQQAGQTWVAVQGIEVDTPILSGRVGGVPAGTAVQLMPSP